MFTPHLFDPADTRRIDELVGLTLDQRRRPGVACRLLLDGLSSLFSPEASATLFFTETLTPPAGTKFVYMTRLHRGDLSEDWRRTFDWRLSRGISPVIDAIAKRVPAAGRTDSVHVHSRTSLVPDAVWRRTTIYRNDIRPLGVTDQLFGWVQGRRSAAVVIVRATNGRTFGDGERGTLAAALGRVRQLPDLRALIQPHCLQPKLSPRQRSVRNLMMLGASDGQVRDRLAAAGEPLSLQTVSEYVSEVLRLYRVERRSEVMAQYYLRGGGMDELFAEAARDGLEVSLRGDEYG